MALILAAQQPLDSQLFGIEDASLYFLLRSTLRYTSYPRNVFLTGRMISETCPDLAIFFFGLISMDNLLNPQAKAMRFPQWTLPRPAALRGVRALPSVQGSTVVSRLSPNQAGYFHYRRLASSYAIINQSQILLPARWRDRWRLDKSKYQQRLALVDKTPKLTRVLSSTVTFARSKRPLDHLLTTQFVMLSATGWLDVGR